MHTQAGSTFTKPLPTAGPGVECTVRYSAVKPHFGQVLVNPSFMHEGMPQLSGRPRAHRPQHQHEFAIAAGQLREQVGVAGAGAARDFVVRAAAQVDVVVDADAPPFCQAREQAGDEQAAVADVAQRIGAGGADLLLGGEPFLCLGARASR